MLGVGTVRVADLRDGETVRVRGRARRAGELLTSSLGERACVYWEVRAGLDDGRSRRAEGVDFWVEDATGRVLIRAARVEVDARAELQERVLGQVDGDISEVAIRQRAVKDAIRRGEGDAKSLYAERRSLAEIATLLCAVRAHARGRVHIGGSLAAQREWIAEHARPDAAQPGQPAASTLRLVVEEWEVAIEEGHEIEVEGLCAREPAPNGRAGGYREQATCFVLRAPPEGVVKISGVGASASVHSEGGGLRSKGRARRDDPAARGPTTLERGVIVIVSALCAAGALLAWWLTP